MTGEDMNEDLDLMIANWQADYLVKNPDIISQEVTDKSYLEHMAFSLESAAAYFSLCGKAYRNLVFKHEYHNTPLQERVNSMLGIPMPKKKREEDE